MRFSKSLVGITTALLTTALLLTSVDSRCAFGCAIALPYDITPLQIAEEDALIIYNEKTRIEEFIRQATFDPTTQNVKDFGFLVPTPTTPTLSTTDSKLLPQIAKDAQPPTIHRTEWKFFGYSDQRFKTATASSQSWVTVQEQRVGDLNAAIMQASNAKALRRWMTENGYATRPTLDKWLASYIKRGWTITAFKVAENSTIGSTENKKTLLPVRMSFRTDHPFYPYQEPNDKKADIFVSRTLRLFYIGSQRVEGKLSADMPGTNSSLAQAWPTLAELSRPLSSSQREKITQLAKMSTQEIVGERLTVFTEHNLDRPTDKDLYFFPTTDQSPMEYPNYRFIYDIQQHDVAEIFLWGIGGAALFFGVRRLRKKRNERLA